MMTILMTTSNNVYFNSNSQIETKFESNVFFVLFQKKLTSNDMMDNTSFLGVLLP